MKNPALSLCVLGIVALAACDTTDPDNDIVTFQATMNSAAEVPAVTVPSTGSGTFTATLDTETNVFTYNFTFSGLTSAVVNGHIHGPADPGVAAGIILDFKTLAGATFVTGATSGTGQGSVVLNAATTISATVNGDSLRKLLLAGKTYANIHTTSNTAGEIRGQILRQ